MRVCQLIFRPVLAALAATFVVRVPAAAQTHLDVVPYVGLYVCGHIMRLTGYRSPLQNDLVPSAGLALSPGGH